MDVNLLSYVGIFGCVLFLWLCFLPNLQPLMSTSLRMPPQTRLSSWLLQRCLPTSTCWTRPLNTASPKAGKRMQTNGSFAKHQKMESFFVCIPIPSNITINHTKSTRLLFGKAMFHVVCTYHRTSFLCASF